MQGITALLEKGIDCQLVVVTGSFFFCFPLAALRSYIYNVSHSCALLKDWELVEKLSELALYENHELCKIKDKRDLSVTFM